MGGYGGALGKVKEKCYYDTGNHKVTDKNAIEVAEYYISVGKYVAFLQEKPPNKRADLSVEGTYTEVKGITSLNPDNIEGRIKHAFQQVHGDNAHPKPSDGKVIILSHHSENISEQEIYDAVYRGFLSAEHKGYVTGKCELWIRGKIYYLN